MLFFQVEKKMETPLGISFSTDENVMTQADVWLLGKTLESLVIEFDQGKFKEFLSSGYASPKAMRQYRKVSSETPSLISSEITPKVALSRSAPKILNTGSRYSRRVKSLP